MLQIGLSLLLKNMDCIELPDWIDCVVQDLEKPILSLISDTTMLETITVLGHKSEQTCCHTLEIIMTSAQTTHKISQNLPISKCSSFCRKTQAVQVKFKLHKRKEKFRKC